MTVHLHGGPVTLALLVAIVLSLVIAGCFVRSCI
jgi:hypothetical protein